MSELAITIHSVAELPNRDLFSKNDPYVVVKCGGNRKRTTTKSEAGTRASFEETLTFPAAEDIRVEIWDEDNDKVKDDDFISFHDFEMSRLKKGSEGKSEFTGLIAMTPKEGTKGGYAKVSLVLG